MPAERTRKSKRSSKQDDQVTQEPNASPPQTISFATNLTPGTFNQPASRAKRVAERRLFPTPPPSSTASQTGKRRNTHAKKKPEDHIPRPPNAFILFRSAFIRNNHITTDIETDHSTLSKIIGLTWRKLPQAERDAWFDDAREKLEEHMVKHPNYVFRPVHDKEKASEKRKVREVGLKDTKRCTKIADLLIDGKRGAELGAAVHEFDRHHVPEVVTRFEAPLTARAYRRSVSEPAADEPSSGFVVPLPSGKSGKARASTAQPEMRIATASPQWSEPSLFESESFSQSDAYSSPSTPFTTSQDIYTGSPSTSPFDFGTFTFQECTSASGESYDPRMMSASYQDSPNNIFAPVPQYTYAPSLSGVEPSLSVDTSCMGMGGWTSSPSPISSSMPGTPGSHDYPPYYAAQYQPVGYQSPLGVAFTDTPPLVDSYGQSLDMFGCGTEYMDGHPGYAPMPSLDLNFSAPIIGASSKQELEMPLYGGLAPNALDISFSPSSTAPVSGFEHM